MSNLKAKEYRGFEQIKHVGENGDEFWYARELAPVLEYVKWENFSKVIDRAMLACRNSGFSLDDHFPNVRKMIKMPSKSQKIGFADLSKTKNMEIGFPDVRKTKMKPAKTLSVIINWTKNLIFTLFLSQNYYPKAILSNPK